LILGVQKMVEKNNIPSPGLPPFLVETLRQRAINLALQGNWKQALQINEIIINSKPIFDDFNRLGKCYMECNRLSEALLAYQKCLKMDPTNAIALKNVIKIKQQLPQILKPTLLKMDPKVVFEQPSIKEKIVEPQFEIGDHVRMKNEGAVGIITAILPSGQYRIFIKQNEEPIIAKDDIEELVSSIGYVTPQEFLRDLLIFKMRRPLSDTLYSYSMSRTNFEAYQFKPAIKFLNNPYGKILIADEVGLGKTIEACIIYLELKARMRGDLPRVLVVCPSGLCTKWRSELSARFGEEFEIMGTSLLRQYFNEFHDSGGTQRLRAICSIETLRREELTEQINNFGVDFDLVIIDEAHHMKNPEALSFDLGETLSAHTDHLIMLTATPVHLHSDDLFYLLNILEPGEFQNKEVFESQLEPNKILNRAIQELCQIPADFDEVCSCLDLCPEDMKINPYWVETKQLISGMKQESPEMRRNLAVAIRNLSELNTFSLLFTRTRRKEVQSGVIREARTLDIELTQKEQKIYEEALHFARVRAKYKRGYVFVLGLIQIERQLASSLGAFREIVEGFGKNNFDDIGIEDGNTELDSSSALPIEELKVVGEHLRSLYDELGNTDSKYDAFFSALTQILDAEPTAKVIVYSFFRKTISYLWDRLTKEGLKVEVIHGGKGVIDRQVIMERFKQANDTRILLSSEVGAEGLDLQFCNTVVNYDLPWNPMRVEQRIGRIDRYGQKSEKIRVVSLFLRNTIEERILKRLYDRIGVFRESIGALEPILGDIVKELSQEVITSDLTPEQETRKAEDYLRMIEQRRLQAENYEKHRAELLGQDMSFVNQVEDNISNGRYVSSKEIRSLVCQYLIKESPKTTIRKVDQGSDCWFLTPDQTLIDNLRLFLAKRSTNPGREDWNFITQLIESISPKGRYFHTGPRGISITFDSKLALERPRIIYSNVWHPLVRLAFDSLEQGTLSEPETRILRFNLKTKIPEANGIRYFFMFYISTSAMVDSNELVTITLDIHGNIDEYLSNSFLKIINDYLVEDSTESKIEYDWVLGQELKEKAHELMAEMKRKKETTERQKNDSLIAIRRSALEKTYEVKTRRVNDRLAKAIDERIIRMHEGELKNLESKHDNAVGELENKRKISVSYEPIACGLIEL